MLFLRIILRAGRFGMTTKIFLLPAVEAICKLAPSG